MCAVLPTISSLTLQQRRCIHDEHGNVDPKKAAEAPVPRGSASKRRRVGDEEDGEALTKRIKMESFAGLVDGEVSLWNRYPLQKPRSYSASASREDTVVDSAFDFREQHVHRREMDIDPRLFEVGGNASGGAAPSNFMSRETVVSSIEDLPGDPMEGVIEAAPPQPRILNPEPRTPPPRAETPPGEANGVFISQIQPSPSPNDIQARPASMTPHWSRSSKGPRTGNAKSTTPKTTPNGKIKTEPKSDQRPRPVPPPPTTGKKNEDMASLALALKLQMEEHGLRRRSK
jgi:F-box/leucine-rich repeat protein 10/11